MYTGGFREGDHLHYLMHSGKEHVLAFAPTRSGKGIGLVIPTLLAWPYSCVVYDIKGENWALTAGFRAKALKQYCFKFSPLERDGSRFNPLAEIRLGTDRELSDAQNIAEMIMTTGDTLPEDNHFVAEATSLTVGLILHICYAAKCDNPHGEATIADLLHLYTDPKQPFIDTLNEILKYPTYAGGVHSQARGVQSLRGSRGNLADSSQGGRQSARDAQQGGQRVLWRTIQWHPRALCLRRPACGPLDQRQRL